ncbi:MAG: hypothetical protein RIR00_1913 [Pseudomonadota bacterium]
MCGILGLVGTPWRDNVAEALQALHQRGPDAQAYLTVGEAVFAHARLSVIDLAGGSQPMRSADGRHTLVFNGEIYNAPALRRELEGLGAAFVTDHSDTEVLLQGFRIWGEALLPRLDGMFAFAIWDARTRTLFAARDKLGIKPFMYAAVAGGLVFASTLAPFLTLPGFPRQLDPEALRDYLAFQTPLAPQTFLRAVRQLPPAHCLRFNAAEQRLETGRWWSIPHPDPTPCARGEILAAVDQALRTSVRRQMAADVPLGAFLSGGIDSSLMVRYLSEASSRPVETFCLQFAKQGFDESQHAATVAQHFGCTHHVLAAPSIDAAGFLQAMADLDQPLADPAYVMTHALSRLTRQHVTVAISGDGGDELFGGYPRFTDTADRHPPRFWQPWLRRGVDAGLLPAAALRRSLYGAELLHYRRVELGPWPGRKALGGYVGAELLAAMRPQQTLALWRQLLDEQGGRLDSDGLMRADLWTYLSENCLQKTDRASMAHGLEMRVPMLGEPVLEVALRHGAAVHLAGGGKALLNALARRDLPECVWNREKHGFSVPLQALFTGAWQDVGDACFNDLAQRAPYLNGPALVALWQQAKQGRASRRLAYTFLVLLIWLDGKNLTLN